MNGHIYTVTVQPDEYDTLNDDYTKLIEIYFGSLEHGKIESVYVSERFNDLRMTVIDDSQMYEARVGCEGEVGDIIEINSGGRLENVASEIIADARPYDVQRRRADVDTDLTKWVSQYGDELYHDGDHDAPQDGDKIVYILFDGLDGLYKTVNMGEYDSDGYDLTGATLGSALTVSDAVKMAEDELLEDIEE